MKFKPEKGLGQNFLTDKRTLEFEADSAGISTEDTILEIGPGDGRLTKILAERAGKVIAIEKDRRMEEFLSRLPENVEIIYGDASKIPLPKADKVVANIPYNLSSKILFLVIEGGFSLSVLTVQKEFAERLVGKPNTKDWGRISATVSFLADVEILKIVPRGAFFPKPKVDSAVIRIIPKRRPENWAKLKLLIDTIFTTPGKTLKNSLRGELLGAERRLPQDLLGKRVRALGKEDLELVSKLI